MKTIDESHSAACPPYTEVRAMMRAARTMKARTNDFLRDTPPYSNGYEAYRFSAHARAWPIGQNLLGISARTGRSLRFES